MKDESTGYLNVPFWSMESDAVTLQRKNHLFSITVVFCVAVPGFASVKAICILLAWAYIVVAGRVRLRALLWFLSVFLSLLLSAEIALLNRVAIPDLMNHLSRFILFFLVLGMGTWMVGSRSFRARSIDRLILVITVLSAALKIAILTAVWSGLVTFDSIQDKLGFESVTDSIGFGIQRLQFPSDIILIFLLTCYTGQRRRADLLFLICATVSVFLSFSRFLFVAYAVCLLIRFFRIRKVDWISGSALGITLLLAVIFSATLYSRFSGEGSQVSDNTRAEQIRYLSGAILENPLLGSGIGASVNSYKRSESIPFSYEVQWYAMTMQLGVLGLAWFVLNLMAPIVDSVRTKAGRVVLAAVFSVWIAGGFTNPFIISLGSAFGLSILMLTLTMERQIDAGNASSGTTELGA
jgi:hypothetical protein